MILSSMKTTIDVARRTSKFYMQANVLLAYTATSGIVLMMSSVHCSSHIVLICIAVNYGLTLRKVV